MSFDPDAPGSADDGIYGLGLQDDADAAVVIVPVPFEATVSYGGGTANGPRAIREASLQIDLLDLETGRPYEAGIYMQPELEWVRGLSDTVRADALVIIEGKNDPEALTRVLEASQRVNRHTWDVTRSLLDRGKVVGTVGGDHSIPLGAIRAHAEHFGKIGILHVDAHADLRVAYEGFAYSHASIMERVLAEVPNVEKLVQVGLRDVGHAEVERIESDDRIFSFFDPEIARARLEGRLLDLWRDAVSELPKLVYCSIDIDGLNPRLCPGTGTPVPGGLEFMELSFLLGEVVRQNKTIVGFDLCEVAPKERGDQWDGNVGARVLYKLIGWALKSGAKDVRASAPRNV